MDLPASPTFGGHVVLRPGAVAALLRSPGGPVAREMLVAGELVRQEAKRLVGYSKPDPVPRRRAQVRPHLRDTIVKRPIVTPTGMGVAVGSDDPIALWHHEGTQAHSIVPVKARHLVFFWPRAGRVVYLRHVNHPGTRPNRFLLLALRVLRARYL